MWHILVFAPGEPGSNTGVVGIKDIRSPRIPREDNNFVGFSGGIRISHWYPLPEQII